MSVAEGPQKTTSGLDENVAAALAYSLGWISGAFFLLTEHQNRFVRFHALQSTLTFGALSVGMLLLQTLALLGVLLFAFVLMPLSAALWLVLMFKAYKGERYKLPIVGDIAEERI